jgi:hypothetical protein
MKKLAAHDLEDLLQVSILFRCQFASDRIAIKCAIPVFDGLLPEPHNGRVCELLFVAAHWHGLAKLRMQTDATLDIMDGVTTDLGAKLRAFKDKTCGHFPTKELQREYHACVRRETRNSRLDFQLVPSAVQGSETRPVSLPSTMPRMDPGSSIMSQTVQCGAETAPNPTQGQDGILQPQAGSAGRGRLPKTLNLNTYKLHALGDYTATIRKYGTTDSYSTEAVRTFLPKQ